jgi:transcription elongation factor GreB
VPRDGDAVAAGDDELEGDGDEVQAAKRAQRRYVTPAGYRRLAAELDQLWRVERPRVTREVADAAALGDRSENAEYLYGKKKLREIDRRLRFLSKRLDELVVVEPGADRGGRVFFGARVELEEASGARLELQIVGPDEFDVAAGRISVDSPLGRALIGKEEGDEFVFQRPKGSVRYTVLSVRYEG